MTIRLKVIAVLSKPQLEKLQGNLTVDVDFLKYVIDP